MHPARVACFLRWMRQSFVTWRSGWRPAEARHPICRIPQHTFSKTTATPNMRVDCITTWQEFSGLQTEWNALAGDVPFRSWDWLATWWKYYGGESYAENGRCSE